MHLVAVFDNIIDQLVVMWLEVWEFDDVFLAMNVRA